MQPALSRQSPEAALETARRRPGPRGLSGQRLTIPAPEPGQRRAWRLREAARAYRLSEFSLRKLMKEGKLPFAKLGKVLLIPHDALEALINPK
jgi:excisionase family DNA binding protein